MSIVFRFLLIIVSIFFFWYVIRKIRKSQLQIEQAIFWIALSFFLIIFSVFPQCVYFLTNICGMDAPVNFVFLAIIFILMLKMFSMSIKLGQLEEKIKNLSQQVAIKNLEIRQEIGRVEEKRYEEKVQNQR